MPKITFNGHSFECPSGVKLRRAILDAGLSPHNGQARWFNCKGLGSCGTCAVELLELEQAPPKTAMERWRLDFPPHSSSAADDRLRLACQLTVTQDLVVKKHEGFWGQTLSDDPAGEDK